ncbi:hypothetical protein EJB05_36900, partial [Eragrostis curvula]
TTRKWTGLHGTIIAIDFVRLHIAIDFVRFHAVCKHWRSSLPPALSHHLFLPWLLSPRVANGDRRARCVFSSKSSSSGHATTYTVRDEDRKWVINADNGAVHWLVTDSRKSCVLVDPFTGSAVTDLLPRNPDDWKPWVKCAVNVAGEDGLGNGIWMGLDHKDGKKFHSTYLVESRGEILWVFVQVKSASYNYDDVDTLVSALSVSIYALQEAEGGEQPQWVKRECRSLADRVLFLGPVRSFAVDAARLGVSSGYAYFIDRRQLYVYDGTLRKPTPERSRVFKYSFLDGKSEFVEELPPQWNRKAFMWVSPRPAIATKKGMPDVREMLSF